MNSSRSCISHPLNGLWDDTLLRNERSSFVSKRGSRKEDESYVLIFLLWNNGIGVCNVSPTFKSLDNTTPHTFKGPLRNMIHTPADCGSSSITFSLTREMQCADYSTSKGFRLQSWYCRWRMIDACAQMEFWSARYQRFLSPCPLYNFSWGMWNSRLFTHLMLMLFTVEE